jgi:DNA-directed RNA polymerase subunit E'/Rpb7
MFCLSIVKVRDCGNTPSSMTHRRGRRAAQDTMAIHPSNFGAPVDDALMAEINKKYANRVLHDVGLCICVFDLSQAGEGKVRYGDGCLWYKGE